jgi:hypothetical protein
MDDGGSSSASGADELLGSLLTRFSALGVASTEDDLITQFALIFSIEKPLARFYLDAGGMSLERSINLYLDNIGASRASAAPPRPAFGFTPVAQGAADGGDDDDDDAEQAMLDSAIQASLLAATRGAGGTAHHPAAFGGGEFAAGGDRQAAAPAEAFATGTAPPSFSFAQPAPVTFGGGTAPPSFSFGAPSAGLGLGARSFVPTSLAASPPMGQLFQPPMGQMFQPPAASGGWGAPGPAPDRTMEE